MKKFSELNNFAKNRISFVDNRSPRVVLKFNSAPNIQLQPTEGIFPFQTSIIISDFIRPEECLPTLKVTIVEPGASISWALPSGVSQSFDNNIYTVEGFTSLADWNFVIENSFVNLPSGFQGIFDYTVELYWFEPAQASISHSVSSRVAVANLVMTAGLQLAIDGIFDFRIGMLSTFGLQARGTIGDIIMKSDSNLIVSAIVNRNAQTNILSNFATSAAAKAIYNTTYLSNVNDPVFYDALSEQNISSISPRLTGVSDNETLTHTMEIYPSNIEFVNNFVVKDIIYEDLRFDFSGSANNVYGMLPGSQIGWQITNFSPRVIARFNITTNAFVTVPTTNSYAGEILSWNNNGTKFVSSTPTFDNNKGRLYIYNVSETGVITLAKTVTGTLNTDELGFSAAFSGNDRLIYSKQANGGSAPGIVTILEFNGSDWIEVGVLPNPSSSSGDGFGYFLAANRDTSVGNRYVVTNFDQSPTSYTIDFFQGSTLKFSKTAFLNTIIADNKFNLLCVENATTLYDWDGNVITNPDGRSIVSISTNGNYIVTHLSGACRVWKRTGTNSWEFVKQISESYDSSVTISFTDDENTIIFVKTSSTVGYVRKYTIIDSIKWTYNNFNKTITLTGSKQKINTMLDNLYFTSNLVTNNYEINYKLTSADPAIVYTRRVEYNPLNIKITAGLTSLLACNGRKIFGSIVTLSSLSNLTAKGTGGKILSDPITLSATYSLTCANSFIMFGNSSVPLRGESFTSGLGQSWLAGISPNTVQDNGIQVIFVSDIIDNDLLLMPAGFSYTNTVNNVSFFDDLCHKTYSTGDVTPYQFTAPQSGSYISKTLIFDKNPNRYRVSSSTTGTGNNTTQTVSNVSSVSGDLFISIVVGKMPNVPINSYTMPAGFKLIDIRREGNLFMAIAGWTSNITGTVGFTTSWTFNTSQPINNWRQTFMALR